MAVAQTDAQKSFTQLKTLAGVWQAAITTDPPSRGNAMVHEVQEVGKPDDPARYDHPLTMFYLEGDHLSLTHYCDAGNPAAHERKVVARRKNSAIRLRRRRRQHAARLHHDALFTFIDANHHTEDWTYMLPGDKPMRAHFDLKRIQ